MSTALTFSGDQLELIKRTFAKDTTDDEFALFVETAKRMGLSPFARQIFAVVRHTKHGPVMSIQVSIDGLRLAADRSGCYAPGRPTEYERDEDKLISATAYVKKLVGGSWHEIGETSYLTEYAGSSNTLWQTMPRTMLAKTAEARALRRAFPAELSGAYADAEMDQAESPRYQLVEAKATRSIPLVETAAIDLLRSVIDATSKEELDRLVPAISKLPREGAARAELRNASKAKLQQLQALALPAAEDITAPS